MLIYRGKINYDKYAVNEAFTLILPTTIAIGEPVFAGWRWTETNDGKTKINAFGTTIIDRVVMSSTKGFGFIYDSYYNFDITENDALPTALTVTMKGKTDGLTSSFSLQRYPEFIPEVRRLSLAVYPRIYVGMMNYHVWAKDEMVIIVVPDILENDADVYAFWQWTHDAGNNLNVNVNYISKVSSSKPTDRGRDFEFEIAGFYTLKVESDEDAETLFVKMEPKYKDNSFVLAQVVDSPPVQRGERAIFDEASLVINDSQEVVYCWLHASGSPLTDQLLAGAGLVLASAGLIALIPQAGLTFGAIAAVAGFAAHRQCFGQRSVIISALISLIVFVNLIHHRLCERTRARVEIGFARD